MTIGSRQAILDQVRAAISTDTHPYEGAPRSYVRAGELDAGDRLHLMTERLQEYGADVVECATAELSRTIHQQLEHSARNRFAVPAGIPEEWLGHSQTWMIDHDLSYEQIESCDGVLTAASAGVAESGTIVLHHGPMEGRRVISLLPDFHLCVLRASQIVETLPEYFASLAEPPRLATYISGPSATADIEMTRIKGVHGPRFLSVIIVRDDV